MSHLVLVVDDDPMEREILERCLGSAGYRVTSAPDGETGLAAARAGRPSLVLLDVMMPRLNGYQTCRALRADPAIAGTPVVMLTAKDQEADRAWAQQVGVNVFLSKPVDVTLLLQAVRELVGPA